MIQSASRRRPLVKAGLAVGAVFVVMVTSAGSAPSSPTVGDCPTAEWELGASPPPGETSEEQSNDRNGDRLSCFLEVPEGGGIFAIVDNISHPKLTNFSRIYSTLTLICPRSGAESVARTRSGG
jgi:hypothetical protein